MSQEMIQTSDGLYTINLDLIRHILRDRAYAEALFDNSRTKRTSQSRWYNPGSWALPDLVTVDVNWTKVRSQRESHSAGMIRDLKLDLDKHRGDERARVCMAGRVSLREMRDYLARVEAEARYFKNKYWAKQKAAQTETMGNIAGAVKTYQGAVDVAKFTRDASAGTLVIGASIISGGAAGVGWASVSTLGAGSVLKGAAKYQDTGNAGAAVLETALSFTIGMIPGPAANATRGDKVALFLVTTKLEAGGSVAIGLAEGKSVQESLLNAAVEVGVGKAMDAGFAKVIKLDGVKDEVSRLALPGTLKVVSSGVNAAAGAQLRGAAVSAIMKDGAPKGRKLNANILIAEPCLASLAIMGPDNSQMGAGFCVQAVPGSVVMQP